MADTFDVIVIGSGFGGAVAACRLSEAGYEVLVLERGRRWQKEDYPSVTGTDWTWSENDPARQNGWLDARLFGSIGTVAGSGVGGGSLHYANVSINAQPDLFLEGWPPEITFAELESTYYPRVDSMLKPERVPSNQLSNRALLVREAAQKAGYESQFEPVELAVAFDPDYEWDASKKPDPDDSKTFQNDENLEQGTCVHLGQCVFGCPVEARNTLALNYIPRAERHGAEVRPLHIARSIQPIDSGYRVFFDRIQNGRLVHGWAAARIVVVAAGTIGSNELLLRCKKQFKTLPRLSSKLGKHWCSNANYLTPAFHKGRDVYVSRGPTISAGIRFFGENNYKGQQLIIEDGGVPDLLEDIRGTLRNAGSSAGGFAPVLRSLGTELQREPFQDLMLWFAQGRDEPIGEFKLRRRFWIFGRRILHLSWDPAGARKVLDAIQELHRTLADKTGGQIFLQLPDQTITPHPLGGCRMAATSHEGVVDHRGAVFGYENLYLADGAILPRAVGHNPSKTIAALSERVSQLIIDEGR